jgi:hypothetical protein
MRSSKLLSFTPGAPHFGKLSAFYQALLTRCVIPSRPSRSRISFGATEGVFSIAFGAFAFCCIAGAVGIMKVFHAVDLRDRTQIVMDRCTGKAAVTVRTILENVEDSNRRMRSYHAASLASVVSPQLLQAIRMALLAEEAYQGSLKLQWTSDSALWLLGSGKECKHFNAVYRNIPPSYPFRENPPLPAGPAPTTYVGRKEMHFHVQTPGMTSKAIVRLEGRWTLRWIH